MVRKPSSGHSRQVTRVITLDPGLSATGWAIVEVPPSELYQVVGAGVIRTSRSRAKKRIRVSDDDINRARQIYNDLWKMVSFSTPKPRAFFVEAFAGAQSFDHANANGIMKGILASLHEEFNEVPFEYYTPVEVRRALLGKKSGTKEEIEEVVLDQVVFNNWLPSSKRDRVHVVDAVAVLLAAREGIVYRTLRS